MKVETSIALAPETLNAIDEIAGEGLDRASVIEIAVSELVQRRRRSKGGDRDLEILNRSAEDLREEIEDILAYQVDL